jgi:hypothetical protein
LAAAAWLYRLLRLGLLLLRDRSYKDFASPERVAVVPRPEWPNARGAVTAKALGITVPLPLSGRADEIFE